MKITDTDSRMTPEDVAVLKAMFEEREGAVEAIRKIFYPELTSDAPIFQNKGFLGQCKLTPEMTPEQKIIEIEAHQKLNHHIEGCLSVIKLLVGTKDETPEQIITRLQKDSSK